MTPGEAFDAVVGVMLLAAAAFLYGLFLTTAAVAVIALTGSLVVAAAALCGLFAVSAAGWVSAGRRLDKHDASV